MESRAHNYAIKSSPTANDHTSTKRCTTGMLIFVGICLLLIILGLGLGLGLRLGLRSSSSISTCDTATAKCGCPSISPNITSRIVNGNIATSNSWPWMVAIYMSNGRLCGGTLVTYEHVLTAAHCVSDVTSIDVVVYAGIQKLSERFNGQVRNVSVITVHSEYSDTNKTNDLAILKLSSPIIPSATTSLCCLPTMSSKPSIGDTAIYIGWGRTSPSSGFSDELRQSVTRVVDSSLCYYAPITDNQICTGNTTSIACYGESGSPLMININNAWACVGVVNMGLLTCDSYVVFTRVAHYTSFISNATST
ncbi:unnamed protein product [Adineta ricciae]|uniref:Peptidase S1 domain-containing protein n=1 Tax=Adineta ricciae TaxID=249248 RepID=A0A814G0A8_ADIRI|nr:unnamed protein product [Adineta ricciae]CAF1425648.1 unnamed protein product [Adineta ricciae]